MVVVCSTCSIRVQRGAGKSTSFNTTNLTEQRIIKSSISHLICLTVHKTTGEKQRPCTIVTPWIRLVLSHSMHIRSDWDVGNLETRSTSWAPCHILWVIPKPRCTQLAVVSGWVTCVHMNARSHAFPKQHVTKLSVLFTGFNVVADHCIL